jgi:hypothetical protein
MENQVRVIDAALHENKNDPTGVVLQGVLDLSSLDNLKVDTYQREVQPLGQRKKIINGLDNGDMLPAVTLGMRGENFDSRGNTFKLNGDVYIIDGLQRISSVKEHLLKKDCTPVHLLATIHFNTYKDWERIKFIKLNEGRLKMSPNKMLNNKREDSAALNSIFNLTTTDKTFVLSEKVCWSQRMNRGELISALTFLKTNGFLHSHKVAARSNTVEEQIASLEAMVEKVGINNVRENLRVFFGLIDECFGLKTVYFRNSSPQLKGGFLSVLAELISDHHDFWADEEEKKLFINVDLRRKIKQFPLNDPQVSRLAWSDLQWQASCPGSSSPGRARAAASASPDPRTGGSSPRPWR